MRKTLLRSVLAAAFVATTAFGAAAVAGDVGWDTNPATDAPFTVVQAAGGADVGWDSTSAHTGA
jgi:hypothetical protein